MIAKSALIYDRPLIYRPEKCSDADILHVDNSLLIVNKPAGLLSVPGKAEDHQDCLASRMATLYPQARIVHRLDLATSGVMVLAMSAEAHRHLGLQFERRHVAKTYIADVWGHMKENSGNVDLPLRCDWPNRPRQIVDPQKGRDAQTHWSVIERIEAPARTRVMLTPITGRSHQLRVHMLSLGYPILGDQLYAPDAAYAATSRLHLHAQSLSIFHPDGGERMTFVAPLPF